MNLQNPGKNQINYLNKNTWFYLNTGVNNGMFNMSCDSYLLENLISGQIKFPVLRVYAWDVPTISLGANQGRMNDYSYPVIKRVSGGQAVLHDDINNELTYSICLNYGLKLQKLYFEISEALILFLKKYNLNATLGYPNKNYLEDFNCFNSKTSADIVVNDIKVTGNAQYRKKEFILQHGSIKLNLIRKLSALNIDFERAALDLKSSFTDRFNIDFLDYALKKEDCEKINSYNLCPLC